MGAKVIATAQEVEGEVYRLLADLRIELARPSADHRFMADINRVDGGPLFPNGMRIPRQTLFLTGIERHFAVALPRKAWEKSWKLGEFCEYVAERTSKDHLNIRVARDQVRRMDFAFWMFGVLATIALAAWWFAMPWNVWIFILPFLIGSGLVGLLGLRHHLHYRRILRIRGGDD